MFTSGCYCQAIRYEASDNTISRTNCHCTMCRGTTGAPCVAWFSVLAHAFRFTKGSPTLFRSSSHATRAFCAVCGTQLTFRDDASPGEVDVTTCNLDDCTAAAPQDHTFSASQVPWLKLGDDLPRYRRSRDQG